MHRVPVICRIGGEKKRTGADKRYCKQDSEIDEVTFITVDKKKKPDSVYLNPKENDFSLEYLESNFASSLLGSDEHITENIESCTNITNNAPVDDLLAQVMNQISFEIDSDIHESLESEDHNSNTGSKNAYAKTSEEIKETDINIPSSQATARPKRHKRRTKDCTTPYKKRGRKLGYRSENTKDDTAVCGVCGAKVSIQDFCLAYSLATINALN